eukprot:gene6630-8803_t
MGDRYGPTNILEVLFNMQTVYGDPRYRPSPWLRRRGAIGLSQTLVLTIDNPEHRNALGPEIYAAGQDALTMASADAGIRSIVITGANGVFSAGGNLHRLQANRAQAPEAQAESIEGLHQWIKSIAHCPKPVIAAVEGAAAGAGFSLALACDLLVAADDAVMVMAYSSIALSPDGGGSWSL